MREAVREAGWLVGWLADRLGNVKVLGQGCKWGQKKEGSPLSVQSAAESRGFMPPLCGSPAGQILDLRMMTAQGGGGEAALNWVPV